MPISKREEMGQSHNLGSTQKADELDGDDNQRFPIYFAMHKNPKLF